MNMNKVFTKEYFNGQLSKYQNLEPKEIGSAKLIYEDIAGRLDGYLYKSIENIKKVPILTINGQTWMSLTPMEIQSHFIPILKAEGVVGVAGLGFGYYIQEILQKDEVESIDVYEINQDVIDMYIANFGEHEKLNIIKADVLEMKGKEYDFFYADIYPEQMDVSAIEHKNILTYHNNIDDYFFWTQEAVVYTLLLNHSDLYDLSDFHIRQFINGLLDEKGNLLLDTKYYARDMIEALEESEEYSC